MPCGDGTNAHLAKPDRLPPDVGNVKVEVEGDLEAVLERHVRRNQRGVLPLHHVRHPAVAQRRAELRRDLGWEHRVEARATEASGLDAVELVPEQGPRPYRRVRQLDAKRRLVPADPHHPRAAERRLKLLPFDEPVLLELEQLGGGSATITVERRLAYAADLKRVDLRRVLPVLQDSHPHPAAVQAKR